jgi:hypothetical protein
MLALSYCCSLPEVTSQVTPQSTAAAAACWLIVWQQPYPCWGYPAAAAAAVVLSRLSLHLLVGWQPSVPCAHCCLLQTCFLLLLQLLLQEAVLQVHPAWLLLLQLLPAPLLLANPLQLQRPVLLLQLLLLVVLVLLQALSATSLSWVQQQQQQQLLLLLLLQGSLHLRRAAAAGAAAPVPNLALQCALLLPELQPQNWQQLQQLLLLLLRLLCCLLPPLVCLPCCVQLRSCSVTSAA